ncbi:MAG: FAD-dependent oxidoreductase [Leptolyngbyaceae cyanobacterium]
MKRDLNELSRRQFDLLIIGSGIYGACIAWEASLRGLSVAIVDKNDFGAATSANSLKIIHGGLRYLQSADVRRMRQSIIERRTLLQIAPHLVHPLPVLVPTYDYGMKRKALMKLALQINDLVSCDRNRRLPDPQKHIPTGRTLNRSDIQSLIPGVAADGLTGGVLFHDAQVYNSERLTLAFVKSAVEKGAIAANYVEMTGILQSQGRAIGAQVRDALTDSEFDIHARAVVNTSGPWMNTLAARLGNKAASLNVPLAKAINLVTRALFEHSYAVGLSSRAEPAKLDKPAQKGGRLFFMAPWRGKSMIGTHYVPYEGSPDDLAVSEREIASFIQAVNQTYPAARLQIEDVSFVHKGLLPRSGMCTPTGNVKLAKQYRLHDHRRDGLAGVLSVVGVKYTTARGVAMAAVEWVLQTLGTQADRPHQPALSPLSGGAIDRFQSFHQDALRTYSTVLPKGAISRLVYNYGSAYPEVLALMDQDAAQAQTPLDDLAVYKAEAKYAVHQEMAQTLSDFMFRRSEVGTAEIPTPRKLDACAAVMCTELGWDSLRTRQEIEGVRDHYKIGSMQYCQA